MPAAVNPSRPEPVAGYLSEYHLELVDLLLKGALRAFGGFAA